MHPSAVVTQFTISCAVELSRLVTSDDTMTSLPKTLSISIKIHAVKPLWCLIGQFPNCRSNPSSVVVSWLRIAFTPPTHADATQLDSCVASASAMCMFLIGHYSTARPPKSVYSLRVFHCIYFVVDVMGVGDVIHVTSRRPPTWYTVEGRQADRSVVIVH